MTITPISPPSVTVKQQFSSVVTPAIRSDLPSLLMGACFQIVDAFSDLGDRNPDAVAGSYRDGIGRVAYSLPNKISDASLVGFEREVDVYLVYGSTVRKLSSVFDEDSIVEVTGATYTDSTRALVKAGALFDQIGVEAGDFARFTYRGEIVDVEIEAVLSGDTLTLVSNLVTENLSGLAVEILRSPAEFVLASSQQAAVSLGTNDDYITFQAQALKTDGITPSGFAGALGDQLRVSVAPPTALLVRSHPAIPLWGVGDAVFTSATADFTSAIGPAGVVGAFRLLVGATGSGASLRDILRVVDGTTLLIETGSGVGLTAQNYVAGEVAYAAADGVTVGANTVASASADFVSQIGPIGAVAPGFYVEVEGGGVYPIVEVLSATSVEVTGTTGTGVGQDITVIESVAAAADGATGALTLFLSAEGGLDDVDFVGNESVLLPGATAYAVASSASDFLATLGTAFLASAVGTSFQVVPTVSPLTLSWDAASATVSITLERAAGLVVTTGAEVETALTTPLDPAYNVVVSDVLTAVEVGTLAFADGTFLLQLDGGANDEQLLLDGDLLGSSTPTAQVYTSFRALRTGITTPLRVTATSREALVGVADTRNPLGLASLFALNASPGRELLVIGVGAVAPTKPSGTLEAFSAALASIQSVDSYCICPLTMDTSVIPLVSAHVDAMSAPEETRERTAIVSSPMPTHAQAAVLASGGDGSSGTIAGVASAEFASSSNFATQGVQAGDLLVVTALATSTTSPSIVNGTPGPLYGIPVVGVKSGDDFVLLVDGTGADAQWNNLDDVSFTVYRAGAAITQKGDQALAIASLSASVASRRMIHHWPDVAGAEVNGTTLLLPGFYMAATWSGRFNVNRPSQPFSLSTIPNFVFVRNSNTYFSKSQLDLIAGGGTWISIQESDGGPVACRMQLTTDTTSIEKREYSITRAVDGWSRTLRAGLSRQVGKNNITQSFLDGVTTSVVGILQALTESGEAARLDLVSVLVDDARPDRILITVRGVPLFPANAIEFTLSI